MHSVLIIKINKSKTIILQITNIYMQFTLNRFQVDTYLLLSLNATLKCLINTNDEYIILEHQEELNITFIDILHLINLI